MAALLIPVVLLLTAYRVFFAGDAPVAVDASATYATAHHSAKFTVLEPSGLPSGWTASSASFATTNGTSVLRVGYLPGSSNGLQLIESDQPVESLLPAELGSDARPGELSTINGRQWRIYPSARDGDRALVLADDGRTTIVIGTASDADLRLLASSLR